MANKRSPLPTSYRLSFAPPLLLVISLCVDAGLSSALVLCAYIHACGALVSDYLDQIVRPASFRLVRLRPSAMSFVALRFVAFRVKDIAAHRSHALARAVFARMFEPCLYTAVADVDSNMPSVGIVGRRWLCFSASAGPNLLMDISSRVSSSFLVLHVALRCGTCVVCMQTCMRRVCVVTFWLKMRHLVSCGCFGWLHCNLTQAIAPIVCRPPHVCCGHYPCILA